MKFLVVLSFVLSSFSALAAPIHPHSAIRLPGETAKSAFKRYRERLGSSFYKSHAEGLQSALDMAVPYKELDFSSVPVWEQAQETKARFQYIRDLRFMKDPEHKGFSRRSTWLYPDDGCFARAGLMVQNLAKKKVTPPGKVFIFGNLRVKTPNAPSGEVTWWYHVAPIVMLGNQPIVLDPAVYPKHPLKLKDWVKLVTPEPSKAKLSLCGPHSYVPNSPCVDKTDDDKAALSDQKGYLSAEWERVKELGRDPEEELGNNPPW